MHVVQQVRSDETGHPRADDRDFHAHFSCVPGGPDHR
jgi:hypothetical protein